MMSGVKDIENDKVHNVTLYLCYNPAEVRPCKLLSDTDDKEKPSANLFKRLSKYFKLFLKDELISAFKRVNESQSDFLWEPITAKENENSGASDKSLEEAGFLPVHPHRDKKKPEKSEQHKRSTLQDNETSLYIESEEREDADVKEDKMRKGKQSSAEDKRIKSRKRERFVKTAVKLKKKSLDDLRETGSEVANIKGHVAGRRNNKSEPKVTCVANRDANDRENVKRFQRHKESRKCQPDTENTRNADHFKSGISRISSQDKQSKRARMDVSCSTPFTKKLPDKRKFFHTSHISEIL